MVEYQQKIMFCITLTFFLNRNEIDTYEQQGIEFRSHIYVPENDPTTDECHYERCDQGHMMKQIASKFIASLKRQYHFLLLKSTISTKD